MVYFGKKQGGGTGPLPTNTATTDGNNTFTGNNSFTLPVIVADPTQDNQAANKQYVDTAVATKADTTALTAVDNKVDANTTAIAGCAKLATDNTFTGTNTFNNAIVAGGNTAIKKAGAELTAVEITNQQAKSIHFDFIQPATGFRNYCSIDFRIKLANGTYENGLKIEARDNAGGLAYTTDCDYYLYDSKEIRGLADPTQNNSAATKAYVDGRTTTYKWEGQVNNGIDQNLLTIGWDKHIIGAVVFRKRSDGQWFCINSNMTQQLYRLDGTGQFKLYGAAISGSPSWTNEYKVYITYIA